MKRYVLVAALIGWCQAHTFAQSEEKRFDYGLFLGPQMSFTVPDGGSKAPKGAFAGVDLGYRFQNARKGWSLRLQPNFSAFRHKEVSGDETTEVYFNFKSKAYSFNVPLLVRYTFLDGKIRPFAEVGGNWIVRASTSYKVRGQFCPAGWPCTSMDSDEKISNADVNRFGALLSAGVEIDAGKVTIPITIRAIENVKRREIYLDALGASYQIPRSRMIQVTAGVTF